MGSKRYATKRQRLHAKYRSTTHYILSSIIPYTESNLKLTFKPNLFFTDLEKLSDKRYSYDALRTSYYRAIRSGFMQVDDNGVPQLTEAGNIQLKRYQPQKLKGAASVLVIFDIPEHQRGRRQKLRSILRELRFVQIQQSVWQSEYDVIEYLVPEIHHHGLDLSLIHI